MSLKPTEEHHINNFDPGAFFTLHDYDSDSSWTPEEIRRTYGLDDVSARDVSAEKKQEVVRGVLDVFDGDRDGMISWEEWVNGWMAGQRLPDFGVSDFFIFSFLGGIAMKGKLRFEEGMLF
jgi:hypothetical protein